MKGFEDDPSSGWYDTWGMNSSPTKPKLNKLSFKGSVPDQPSHWKFNTSENLWYEDGEVSWQQGQGRDWFNWWK